jgi:hypothetical protein
VSSNSEHSNGLDLGLSALLRDLEKAPELSAPATVTSAASPVAAQLEPPPPAPLNEFETLAEGKRWTDLVRLCEERIADALQDRTEPRLWWVLAQLHSAELPVGLLVAPLEAALEPVAAAGTDPRIVSLAARTLAAAGAAALRAHDGELRVAMCHRAAQLDAKYEPELVAALEAEESRLRSQAGLSSAQQEVREKRLRALDAIRPARAQTAAEKVLAMARAHAGASAERSVQSAGANAMASIQMRTPLSIRPPMGRQAAVVATALVLFLCGAWVVAGKLRELVRSSELGELVASSVRSAGLPELKLSKNTVVETVSAFDGLYYDLKDEPRGRSGAAQPARSAHSSVSTRQGGGAKQVLSMDGPAEPAKMQEAMLQPERPAVDNTAATLFGGADSGSGAPTVGAGQGFEGPRIFKALVRTPILAEPRYQAQSLGTLSVGDRVSAEAKVQDWIRIRSASGRVGFVLAQDLDPET